ncbi:14945_t:CDS:2 [Dentiscutata erythropus]|uniref:14945_t:CDS:1 n=1 Tax=Dentiscutata erythropus TaxID=1348616 RepID=A0A9N9E0K3_9GLOM|nr:14945_t:CDS:2 [Dentiscutata erythropus]
MLHGFEYYWNQLLDFPNAKPYLECYLYKRRHSWAHAFTIMAFILGIQSTSFVKSQNVCIKQVLKNSNMSLCDLEQMKESLYYTASHSTIEEVESLTVHESLQCKDIDNKFDAVYLSAKYLLDHLEQNSIKEIWKVSRVTSYWKAEFSLILIAAQWIPRNIWLEAAKKSSDKSIVQESSECQFVWLQLFASNETENPINEDLGLAHTAINKCMLHRDYEFVGLIKAYLDKIHVREDELIEKQEATADQDSIENIEGNISIVNP